ncbi:MAG: hypothetical protein P4M15_01030, partial [Alphaproteobacteria bacterium]|nr:hypothetical protein [Alphaproteobacteria bacterium]
FSTSLISLTPHPENALASKPPPRYSPPTSNCCTSNVNPPPGLRRDDGSWGKALYEAVSASRKFLLDFYANRLMFVDSWISMERRMILKQVIKTIFGRTPVSAEEAPLRPIPQISLEKLTFADFDTYTREQKRDLYLRPLIPQPGMPKDGIFSPDFNAWYLNIKPAGAEPS